MEFAFIPKLLNKLNVLSCTVFDALRPLIDEDTAKSLIDRFGGKYFNIMLVISDY